MCVCVCEASYKQRSLSVGLNPRLARHCIGESCMHACVRPTRTDARTHVRVGDARGAQDVLAAGGLSPGVGCLLAECCGLRHPRDLALLTDDDIESLGG